MKTSSWAQIKTMIGGMGRALKKNIADALAAANKAKETADNKMNATNPTGKGYFLMNPIDFNAPGEASHTEGNGSAAKGFASHAEGDNCYADGHSSHAEGRDSGAEGEASHSEGRSTRARGNYSHAEGHNTEAIGSGSHAEGARTTARGSYSHAEGHYTEAVGSYSHVQGKYSVADAEEKYAHIVGNGTGYSKRSNAHTLDWDGNAWFAGDVYVGGSSQDDGQRLVTENELAEVMVLTSPNGTRYKLTLTDDGTLAAVQVSGE